MKRVLKFVKGKASNVNGSSSRSVLSESSSSEKDSRISSQKKDELSITEIKKTLQNASCNGNIDELAKYLSYIDVNCVDNLGRTLLNVAALNGHLSCVEFLLSNCADPSIRDLNGMTPLLNAVERNHVQCVDVILTNKETKSTDIVVAAHLAIKKENYEIISLLINKQLNLSKTNEFGENCLHIAAKLQCLNIVNLLLHHKYPIDEIDINSKTSLMVAASLGNIEIVRLLISFKAKLKLKDMEGMTAADLALKNGYIEVYNELQNANKIEDSDRNDVPEKVTAFEQSASEICENQNDSDEWNDSVASEVDDKKSKKINLVSLMTIKDSYGTEMEVNMDEKNVAGSINTASENSDQTLKEIDELTDNSAPQSLTNFLQLPKNKKDVDILSIASGGKEEISIRSSVSASPQSGVIPPPCKPLRSLEYLQSTEFPGNSDPFMYLKANRLFTLGTVRTRHISFTETAASKEKFNSLQRRSFHDEYSDIEKNENSLEFHDLKVSHKTKGSQCSDDSPNVSNKIDTPTSESDWGSDKSLPIQNINSHSSNSPKSDNSSSSRSKHSSFLKSLKNASIRNIFPLKSNTNSKENVKFSETVDNSIQTISEKISDNIKSETVMTNINSQQLVVKHVSADGIDLPLVFELNQNAQVNFKSPDNNSYEINEALQHNDKFMKTQLESYDDALKHLEKCDLNTIYQKSKSLPRTTSPPVNMFQIGSLSLPRTLTADAFSEVKGVYKYSPQSLFPWRRDKVSEYHTLPRKKIKLFDRIKHVFDNKTQKMKSDSHKVVHSLHSNDKFFKEKIDRSSNNINKSVIKNNRKENKEERISASSDKINIQHKSMYFDDSERSKNEDVIVTYKDVCLQNATTNIDIEPNASNESNLSSIEATEEIQYLTTLIQDSSEVKPQTVEETPLDESLKWKKQFSNIILFTFL